MFALKCFAERQIYQNFCGIMDFKFSQSITKEPRGFPFSRLTSMWMTKDCCWRNCSYKGNVLYIHFAPPCGTCSAARTIRLSRHRHGPRPLRSMTRPMGLDNLTPIQRQRVMLANRLYEWTVEMIFRLDPKVIWSVENPSSSLMWMTTPFQRLMKSALKIFGVSFHTCMYNAPRKKTTALWGNFEELKLLGRTWMK